MVFYGQCRQDEFVEKCILHNYKNGVFVDVGAHDGITINNTLYFEKINNWSGINIEPIPDVYSKLINNRPKCINLNYAVSDKDGSANFILNKGYTEMLSGLQESYHQKHYIRRDNEIKSKGGSTDIVKVETKRLETILDIYKIYNINYLSIDVEGGEFSVIKSINFNKVFIDIINFECNYKDEGDKIIKFLKENNFKLLIKSEISKIVPKLKLCGDIFMIHKDSKFYSNIPEIMIEK